MSSYISPNVTHTPLPYHEITASRLPTVTVAGLQAAGIPLEALGARVGTKQVLTACFTFSSFARDNLPPSLGGADVSAEQRLTSNSTAFLQAVTDKSPVSRVAPVKAVYRPSPVDVATMPPVPQGAAGTGVPVIRQRLPCHVRFSK